MSKVTETHVMGDKPAPWAKEGGDVPNHWRVTLRYQGRRLTVDFWTGSALGEPDADDVMECLVSDALLGRESFEEFCDVLGYDTDSRRAHTSWIKSRHLGMRVAQFLGDDFDRFASGECVR